MHHATTQALEYFFCHCNVGYVGDGLSCKEVVSQQSFDVGPSTDEISRLEKQLKALRADKYKKKDFRQQKDIQTIRQQINALESAQEQLLKTSSEATYTLQQILSTGKPRRIWREGDGSFLEKPQSVEKLKKLKKKMTKKKIEY